MPNSKTILTDALLRKIKPTGERYEISDTQVVGLRARVSTTGKVSFILKTRDAASKLTTVTLGQFPSMTLKTAREDASRKRLDLKAGRDINEEKRNLRLTANTPSTAPTLAQLVIEYEAQFGDRIGCWRISGPRSTRSDARRRIERVYATLLEKDVTTLTEEEFARAALSYKRVSSGGGRTTANGQVSRARGYLGPVLNWASGRKKYAKIGASRVPKLDVVSLENVVDPASDDPSITGKRTRVLTESELKAVLPLLQYPSPKIGKLTLAADRDFRPIATRFLLFTASRLEEVCAMRWQEIDRVNNVWHKPHVKSTKGGPRSQDLPLSEAAMDILRSLPGWGASDGKALVFPNGTGRGKLDNWTRFQNALHETTSTADWHRHDLRRTAATIMHSLKVPASTIEQVLAHKDPLKGDNVGGAASHYLQLTRVLRNSRDPQEEALSILAEALSMIEHGEVSAA